ncbi:MAG TPA: hypothetical protein VKV28_06725 [Candidatus Binataceae bacterium]|nr:hypothetical protein [Candidatus Binataceae bacterium]
MSNRRLVRLAGMAACALGLLIAAGSQTILGGGHWSAPTWVGTAAAQTGPGVGKPVARPKLMGNGERLVEADANGHPKGIKVALPAKFQALLDSYAIPGGDIMPASALCDPFPEFNGIAIDSKAGIAVLSDTNLKSVLIYSLAVPAPPDDSNLTQYLGWVKGPNTFLSFAAGVAVDPVRHEFYTTENDVGDDVAGFPYSANGNFHSRVLAVPHGSYGIALSQRYKQMAVSIQHNAEIIFYRLQAHGAERPLRSIRGPHTGLADPHGVVWDDAHGEIFVSNYGNWNQGYWDADYSGGGKYFPPSIRIFKDDSKGDAAPIRVIQGPKTELNWPTGIAVDPVHNELFVANEAANQILVFARDADGDAVPLRVLGGPRTGIRYPMGVAYDASHDQLWVANFGHTAVVFGRADEGDAPPRRVIRNAPEGTPSAGFGNPMALAYDSKRDQLLVPN